MAGGRGEGATGKSRGDRIPVSLACDVCKTRNYKTTRNEGSTAPLELKKFCKNCKQHTLHRETK